MTDRGLPIVDGAPACPFVAFEDDRDGRALAPDHRHRCFAEPRPAPRALAHQEAYCLASAFPVCPTFQDWARREAAAARPAAAHAQPLSDEPPVSRPMPPLERDEYRSPGTDTPPPIPPRRNPQRDWAAPPPWSGEPAPPPPPESRGLAGSSADRLAGPDPADPLSPASPRPAPHGDLDTDHVAPAGDSSRYAPPGSAVAGAAAYGAARSAEPEVEDAPDWAQGDPYARPDGYATPSTRPPAKPDRSDERPPSASPHDQVRRQTPQEASDLFGPAWERPHRYEAYPSLKTRVGLPSLGGLGRIGGAFLALLLAAVALFFIGPMLLGIGGPDDGAGAGAATSTPVAEVTPVPEPTEPPAPTPKVYVVAKGDTISKIAKKHDLTIEQLLAANPLIKNPDRISIGDEITIPVPEEEGGGLEDGEASPEP
jgi:hypothetical protein